MFFPRTFCYFPILLTDHVGFYIKKKKKKLKETFKNFLEIRTWKKVK